MDRDRIKEIVKGEYRQPALQAKHGGSSCCRTTAPTAKFDPITSDLVLAEAFRVLKPGGRLAVSDIIVRGPVPAEIRKSMERRAGCVAGALEEQEYRDTLAQAGFQDITIEPTRVYSAADAQAFLAGAGLDSAVIAGQVDGTFMSGFVRARKPN